MFISFGRLNVKWTLRVTSLNSVFFVDRAFAFDHYVARTVFRLEVNEKEDL